MNISDFKSIIQSYGGPARPNLFYVEILGINSKLINDWELKAFCKSTILPGINLSTYEYKPNNMGIGIQMPIGIQSEPITCIFMMDSDHKILSFFHQWMQKIVNYSTTNGNFASIQGNQLPYEIGLRKEYSANMKITFMSADNFTDNYSVTLEGVAPINIQSVNLSWDENDTIALLPVTFTYEKITFDSEKIGKYRAKTFESVNIEEIYSYLNGFNYNDRSNTIQDLINRIYKIKTDYETLKEIL